MAGGVKPVLLNSRLLRVLPNTFDSSHVRVDVQSEDVSELLEVQLISIRAKDNIHLFIFSLLHFIDNFLNCLYFLAPVKAPDQAVKQQIQELEV